MNINEALNSCLSNMKASVDFNDLATVNSIKDLLQCVIDNPAELINFADEEKLSIALSSVLTCQFPSNYPTYKDINVRNLVKVCLELVNLGFERVESSDDGLLLGERRKRQDTIGSLLCTSAVHSA